MEQNMHYFANKLIIWLSIDVERDFSRMPRKCEDEERLKTFRLISRFNPKRRTRHGIERTMGKASKRNEGLDSIDSVQSVVIHSKCNVELINVRDRRLTAENIRP